MATNKATRSLGRPVPDAKRPRNPFDRSFRAAFNSKVGHLLPVFQLWAPAGSHVKINRSEFIRTFDIVTSSFVPLDHFIDFFAVKISDLWSYWDNWYLNINDMHSSFGNALQVYNSSGNIDDQVKMRTNMPAFSMYSILQYIDGNNTVQAGTGELQYTLNGNQVLSNDIMKFNARRLANLLRYPCTVAGTLDAQGQYLGMTPDNFGYVHDGSNQFCNLIPACAYQKVYYEHYRNNSYESQNPFFYNLDWMANSNNGLAGDQTTLQKFFGNLFNLHSVNFRKDFYQSAYPALDYVPVDASQQSWSVPSNVVDAFAYLENPTGNDSSRWTTYGTSLSSIVGDGKNVYMPGTNNSSLSRTNNDEDGSYNIRHTHLYQQSLSPNAYNVQAIRAAFALDKLKRASAYAPRHIKDQYEARFGFKYKGDDHHSIKLGSFKCSITPYEVTQTAPGQDAQGSYQPLGTIGGKGVGSSSYQDEIDFDCSNCDYIIMGMSYAIPRLQYDTLKFDPFITKFSLNDFFQPEFENLGLQPVLQKHISWSTLTTPSAADAANNILRYYQTRYQEYKTGIDTNFGLFNRDCQLSPFVSHFNLDRRVFGLAGLDWRFFKVLPTDVDNMFVSQADPTELTDHFFGIIDFSVKCTQLMSVHGQPSL